MTTQKATIRKMLILFTIAGTIIFSSPKVKAQGEIAAGSAVVKGLYTAAKWTHENWKTITWLAQGIKNWELKYRWWACIYGDGFVTYNNFRSYRTSMDAYKYFVKGQGDCDAVYGSENNRICYENPMQAKRYTNQHGEIVDIQYQDNNGRYHSIFKY